MKNSLDIQERIYKTSAIQNPAEPQPKVLLSGPPRNAVTAAAFALGNLLSFLIFVITGVVSPSTKEPDQNGLAQARILRPSVKTSKG